MYCLDVIKDRWIELEEIILNCLLYIHQYASKILKRRWEEGERQLIDIKDSKDCYYYSFNVIKDRWPEAIQQAE